MINIPLPLGPSHRRRLRRGPSLHVELLETRNLLSGVPGPDAPDILDPLLLPDLLQPGSQAEVNGSLFNRADGAGDVDWYRFDLETAASVALSIPQQASGSLAAVLSLYNSTEPFDSIGQVGDRYETIGHRLLAQTTGDTTAGPQLVRELAAGTYFVAVSGAGNFYFHPFLAGSGYPGSTGDYCLQIHATDLPLIPGGPEVLGVEPGPALNAAPLVVRVRLSGPLQAGTTLEVRAAGNQPVAAEWTNFSTLANEWQFAPQRALAPGGYAVVLIDGVTETVVSTFQVAGVEDHLGIGAGADDHAAGAHELGNVLDLGLVQRVGAIGDDPAYDPLDFAHPLLQNRSADVDLYHFEITTTGTYGLVAEVFAGRIGSPLDPGLSLFRVNGLGQLELVAANDNTFNDTATADGGRLPLLNDSLLFAGLTPGHYYLAVSSSGPSPFLNVPDPDHGLLPGPSSGIFDPNLTHSGLNGATLGTYVLNLVVFQDTTPPTVVSSDPAAGQVVSASPAQVVVQFSEAVNLPLLANRAFFATFPFPPGLAAAYVVGTNGQILYLGLQSYDPLTNRATFQVPGQLANGDYELRLAGVADLAGNPLAGAAGEFVIAFTVNAGAAGIPLVPEQEPNDDPFVPQDLGTVGPLGLGVEGSLAVSGDFADAFRVTTPQDGSYLFVLSPQAGSLVPAGLTFLVLDAFGTPVPASTLSVGQGIAVIANALPAGTYQIMAAFLDPLQAVAFNYQLLIVKTSLPENPPALTTGPAPALGLRLTTRVPGPPLPSVSTRLSLDVVNPTITPAVFSDSPFAALINTLPPGSLQALGVGPLGGVGGPVGSAPLARADRLQLGNFETALLAGLIRLTLLTPVSADEGLQEGEDLDRVWRETLHLMEKSWEQLLDGLFSLKDAPGTPAAPTAEESQETAPVDEALPPNESPDEHEEWTDHLSDEVAWVDWQPNEVGAAIDLPAWVEEATAEDEAAPWAVAVAAVAAAWPCQHARRNGKDRRRLSGARVDAAGSSPPC